MLVSLRGLTGLDQVTKHHFWYRSEDVCALQNGSYDAWTEEQNISPEARDLLRGLLTENPEARMSSADVLGHPWLQQGVNKVWLERHKAIVTAEVSSWNERRLVSQTAFKADSEVGMSSADMLGHPWLQQGVNKVWLERHKAIVTAEVSLSGSQNIFNIF